MKIKKILGYVRNYAEYIVTDGEYDLLCMCCSVPLPFDEEPKIGMTVSNIIAFSIKELKIFKISNEIDKRIYFEQDGECALAYRFIAKIFNRDKSLVKIGDFIISLEYDYVDGLPKDYVNGEFIEFSVDRLDCYLEHK